MILAIILLIFGFVLLVKGADVLVEGASSLAKKFSIAEMTIGLTVVAFGTSAPELIVNIFSSIEGHADFSIGNIIGSNIFNILLALGVAGTIYPITLQRKTVQREIPLVLISTILVFGLVNNFGLRGANLSRLDGIILILAMILFLYYVTFILKAAFSQNADIKEYTLFKTIIFLLAGVLGLYFGGKLVVSKAVEIARTFNVSEKLIGLTVLALGTSLPELVTSVVAVKKRRSDLAVGNVLGSNIFNLLLVLGVSSTIKPISYNLIMNFDFIYLIIITFILFIFMYIGRKHKLTRNNSILFIIFYLVYLILIIMRK